jgi:hypothetical protein
LAFAGILTKPSQGDGPTVANEMNSTTGHDSSFEFPKRNFNESYCQPPAYISFVGFDRDIFDRTVRDGTTKTFPVPVSDHSCGRHCSGEPVTG